VFLITWVVMVLPPGGFLVLGGWLLIFEWMKQRGRAEAPVAREETVHGR
jgi:electron transport complex protein RnfE